MDELVNNLLDLIEQELNKQTMSASDRVIIYEELANRLDHQAELTRLDNTDQFGH